MKSDINKINILLVFLIIILIFFICFSKNTINLKSLSKLNESYKNLNNNNLNTSNFDSSVASSLGNIFKYGDLNMNSYPNIKNHLIQSQATFKTRPLFEDNKILPECCLYYSQYSTTHGCPCVTPDQEKYLKMRASNKHKTSFLDNNKDYKNMFYSITSALKGNSFPFNENLDISYNSFYTLTDASINEFYTYTNNSSYETESKI
tara:strand:- start:170 stop:784 length:615 start_codon:yes stop_codon:yes gene_type:complete